MVVTSVPLPAVGRRRRTVSAAVLVASAVLTAACTAAAQPGVPGDVARDRYQFSADGVNWGGAEVIPWDRTTIPVPGGEPNATTFHLRVSGGTPVTAEVYLGNWSVDRGTAWARADVDGSTGEKVTVPGASATGPGVLVEEFPIDAGDSVVVTLNVGMPFSEVEQSARIAPDWGVVLRQTGGGGGGSGSIGTGSAGSVGSSPSGSSGSTAGSSGSSTPFGSLGGPLVPGS